MDFQIICQLFWLNFKPDLQLGSLCNTMTPKKDKTYIQRIIYVIYIHGFWVFIQANRTFFFFYISFWFGIPDKVVGMYLCMNLCQFLWKYICCWFVHIYICVKVLNIYRRMFETVWWKILNIFGLWAYFWIAEKKD